MKFIKLLSVVLISLFCNSIANSQTPEENPIKWRMSVKMTSATEGVVTVTAIVSPGWHLYGMNLPEDGPISTTFDFGDSKGIKFKGEFTPSEKPGTHKDSNFGMELQWWEKNVSFSRKFVLTGKVSDAVVSGSVRFMACNDMNCIPPKTVSFKTNIKPYTAAK